MRLIRLSDQLYPYQFKQLRDDNPSVSIPIGLLDDTTLAALGAALVALVTEPTPGTNQQSVEGAPEFVGGQWQQTWTLESIPVPNEVESARLWEEILVIGKLNQVRARMGTNNGNDEIAWLRKPTITRAEVELTLTSPPVNLSQSEVDDLFLASR